jgi:hypothetical protein
MDARQPPAAVLVAYLELAGPDVLDRVVEQPMEIRHVDRQVEIAERSADVGVDQVQDRLRARREAADAQVAPEEDDRDQDAVDQVREVVAVLGQLEVAGLELLIDRVELLVARLDLLLRGLELLVDALELLVRRLHLLVRRLQILVRGLLLLDHGLEEIARRPELVRQPPDLVRGLLGHLVRHARVDPRDEPRTGGGLLEDDEVDRARSRAVLHGHDLDVDFASAADRADAQALLARRGALLPRALERGAQSDEEPLAGHLQQVEAGPPLRRDQVGTRVAAELEDVPVRIDEHPRRGVLGEEDAVCFRVEVGARTGVGLGVPLAPFPWPGGRGPEHAGGGARRETPASRLPGVDPVAWIEDVEELALRSDRLGGPEPEAPSGIQRIVEGLEGLVLERSLHVDEQVPAADEVDPREGRVGEDVVAREDAPVADRLRDTVPVLLLDEIAPQPLRRDLRSDRLGVQADARLLDPSEVEVRGEDLRGVPTAGSFGELVEGDRDRVRLLAGRASENPHAERSGERAALREARENLLVEDLEGPGIAEEARDADQDVLAQRRDLGRIPLEELDVMLRRVEAERSIRRAIRRLSVFARYRVKSASARSRKSSRMRANSGAATSESGGPAAAAPGGAAGGAGATSG